MPLVLFIVVHPLCALKSRPHLLLFLLVDLLSRQCWHCLLMMMFGCHESSWVMHASRSTTSHVPLHALNARDALSHQCFQCVLMMLCAADIRMKCQGRVLFVTSIACDALLSE